MLKQDGTRSEEQKDAAQVESYVAQRYIENPYLINGDKLNEEYTFIVVNYQMCLEIINHQLIIDKLRKGGLVRK